MNAITTDWKNKEKCNITISFFLLFFLFFFFLTFGPYRTTGGILVPQPGIELMPPAVEAQSLDC